MRPLTQNEINDEYKEIIEDNISIITNDDMCRATCYIKYFRYIVINR